MASPIPETTPSLLPKVPFREILWSKKVEIGRGSYAQVFELKHNITRSVYAAKELIIPPPIKNNTESNAAMKSGFFRICDSWSRLPFGRRDRIADHDIGKDARQRDVIVKRTR